MSLKIYIASDHAGLSHKEKIIASLLETGYNVIDCGNKEYDENDDYPDFMSKVAMEVSKNPDGAKGIVLGGSGQGEAIVCNRYHKVRAATFYGPAKTLNGEDDVIGLAREHNDANVLSLGARFITVEQALNAVTKFLETPFSKDERHIRRIAKIEKLHG